MRALALLLLVATCIVPARAQRPLQETLELLGRVMRAQTELRYVGRRLVEFRGLGERQRRIEIVTRDGLRVRTEFPADGPGAGQIIVENQRERRHYFPDTNEIHVSPARQEIPIMRLRETLRNVRERGWKIVTREGGTVAGIRAVQIDFADPDDNVIQRLLVDPTSALVLKRELFDRIGGRVALMEFQSVDLTPTLREDDFTITRRGARIVTIDELANRLAARLRLRPARLPATSGYVLGEARTLPLGPATALELAFFGPGGTFSVFHVRAEINPRRLRMRLGPRAAARSWKDGEVSIAVVGDMPQPELDRLARLIRASSGSEPTDPRD
jgi:hypothetical protein